MQFNIMNESQFGAVRLWLDSHGAKTIQPKHDALKILEELLELCFASGCTQDEIMAVCKAEFDKAYKREEDQGVVNRSDTIDEVGDVAVTLAAYIYKWDIPSETALRGTFRKLAERKWSPDEGGILRRPR